MLYAQTYLKGSYRMPWEFALLGFGLQTHSPRKKLTSTLPPELFPRITGPSYLADWAFKIHFLGHSRPSISFLEVSGVDSQGKLM